jgi:hypothetical protein
MPNSTTSLKKLINFVDENQLKEMQKWSTRNRYMSDGQLMRYSRQMIKNIRKILVLISGNDITAMLQGKTLVLLRDYYLIINTSKKIYCLTRRKIF